MAQKILRTMQDDLKEAREKQQQTKNNPSREENKQEGSWTQIKDSLQQPTAHNRESEAFEINKKTPVFENSNSLNLSDLNPSGEEIDAAAEIKKELGKMPSEESTELANKEEEKRKALEEERKKIEEEAKRKEEERKRAEEMLKKAEEERREKERKDKEEELRQMEKMKREKEEEEKRKRIEEAKKKAEEDARKKAKAEEEERKMEEERMKAEKIRLEEEKRRQEEMRVRAQAEAMQKAQEEKSEEDKEKQKLEEEAQRIERERSRIEELKKREEELEELKKRQEEIAKEEELEKKIEEERKSREEEEMRRIEELRRKEEEIRQAEEEAEKREEELAKQEEEEIKKTEEEAKRIEEEAKRIEENLKHKEEELQQMEEEERERIAALKRKEEEREEAEKELKRKEEELRKKEIERQKREELRKRMRAEILGEELPENETDSNNINENVIVAPEPTEEIIDEEKPAIQEKNIEKYSDDAMPEQDSYSEKLEAPVRPEIPASKPQINKGDEELSSLIKRVSGAMNTTVKKESDATPTIAEKPEKDKDLKNLISRMSKSLEKEKEILQQEQGQKETETSAVPQPDPKDIEDDKPAAPKLEPIPDMPEQPARTSFTPGPTLAQTAAMAKIAPTKVEAPVNSYWSELHDTLKNKTDNPATEQHIDAQETGVIAPKETVQEQTSPLKKNRAEIHNGDYVNPENRLIFGKQEFYSSMHKKVKPRTQEADLGKLKNTVKEERVELSEEEEKNKLKHQIITKYKVKLFSLPWAKIIIFTVLLLATIGTTLYIFIPKFIPKEEVAEELTTGESIAEVDKLVPQKITAKQKEVITLNYFDSGVDPWKSLADESVTRLIINHDEHEVMLPRDEALKAVLGESNFNNMPQSIIRLLDNKYNILAFKNNDVLRLGIVMKYDKTREEDFKESMINWGNTSTKAEKIHNVMRALFVNSKVEERSSTTFQPSTYGNTEIYYLNLPDTDTSMDYFIYKGYVVFTTSKDTTAEMIDLLQQQ